MLKLEDVPEQRLKLEEYLDRGVGGCRLRDAEIAKLVQNALRFFHDERYELLAWCVLPNPVQVLLDVRMTPLGKRVQSWNRFTATHAEAPLTDRRSPTRLDGDPTFNEPGRRPALQLKWQREYWHTFMRDDEQARKAVRYIENNPVNAKLCSAQYRNEYRRLAVPMS